MSFRASFLILFLFFGLGITVNAQVGGENTYEFLTLSNSARSTATGGQQISLIDEHSPRGGQNPALYNDSMHHRLSAGIVNYFEDISYGNVAYAWNRDSLTNLGLQVTYISYGTFQETNQQGQIIGEFSGGETAFSFGGSRKVKKFTFGVNLKAIYSGIAEFRSFGLAADLGAVWHNPEKRSTAGLVIKNLGSQLKPFRDGNFESLPFDIQLGFSKRLEHVPFRFSLQANNLHRWDIRYDDPRVELTTGIFAESETSRSEIFFDNLFRHVIIGGELYFGKAVALRAGFNFLRRRELALVNKNGLTGFSFGGSINIRWFQFDYGFSSYHVAGGAHHFSISRLLK